MKSDIVIIIPTLNPDNNLPALLRDMRKSCDYPFIIVDDGSKDTCKEIFDLIANEISNTIILKHAINCGKGRALKTAFNYLLLNYPMLTGAITADADGQHLVSDIIKCAETLKENSDSLVLGCRVFSGDNVPWKSSFGNNVTKVVFGLCSGAFISDTQTGLRGIPTSFMKKLMNSYGERFEFETVMLLDAASTRIPFKEVPIETVYLNSNRETHFRPIIDSYRIYLTIFRYMFSHIFLFLASGLSSALLDISLFALLFHTLFSECTNQIRLFSSIIVARAVSMIYNYSLNRLVVFKKQNDNVARSFPLYLMLCIVIFTGSYLLTAFGQWLLPNVEVTIIKAAADIILFFASFLIQRNFIFRAQAQKTL